MDLLGDRLLGRGLLFSSKPDCGVGYRFMVSPGRRPLLRRESRNSQQDLFLLSFSPSRIHQLLLALSSTRLSNPFLLRLSGPHRVQGSDFRSCADHDLALTGGSTKGSETVGLPIHSIHFVLPIYHSPLPTHSSPSLQLFFHYLLSLFF